MDKQKKKIDRISGFELIRQIEECFMTEEDAIVQKRKRKTGVQTKLKKKSSRNSPEIRPRRSKSLDPVYKERDENYLIDHKKMNFKLPEDWDLMRLIFIHSDFSCYTQNFLEKLEEEIESINKKEYRNNIMSNNLDDRFWLNLIKSSYSGKEESFKHNPRRGYEALLPVIENRSQKGILNRVLKDGIASNTCDFIAIRSEDYLRTLVKINERKDKFSDRIYLHYDHSKNTVTLWNHTRNFGTLNDWFCAAKYSVDGIFLDALFLNDKHFVIISKMTKGSKVVSLCYTFHSTVLFDPLDFDEHLIKDLLSKLVPVYQLTYSCIPKEHKESEGVIEYYGESIDPSSFSTFVKDQYFYIINLRDGTLDVVDYLVGKNYLRLSLFMCSLSEYINIDGNKIILMDKDKAFLLELNDNKIHNQSIQSLAMKWEILCENLSNLEKQIPRYTYTKISKEYRESKEYFICQRSKTTLEILEIGNRKKSEIKTEKPILCWNTHEEFIITLHVNYFQVFNIRTQDRIMISRDIELDPILLDDYPCRIIFDDFYLFLIYMDELEQIRVFFYFWPLLDLNLKGDCLQNIVLARQWNIEYSVLTDSLERSHLLHADVKYRDDVLMIKLFGKTLLIDLYPLSSSGISSLVPSETIVYDLRTAQTQSLTQLPDCSKVQSKSKSFDKLEYEVHDEIEQIKPRKHKEGSFEKFHRIKGRKKSKTEDDFDPPNEKIMTQENKTDHQKRKEEYLVAAKKGDNKQIKEVMKLKEKHCQMIKSQRRAKNLEKFY